MPTDNHRMSHLSWSVFDGFSPRSTAPSWAELELLVSLEQRYAEEKCSAFPTLLARWRDLLAELGGDPGETDWSHFRPLRVDREEDWSDWLQHFLATSERGDFARFAFPRCGFGEAADWSRPEVTREDATKGRRADLVVRWRNGDRCHVEVKVGDQHLSKTVDTALELESKYPGAMWTHYLLVPAEDAEQWSPSEGAAGPTVHLVTWDDIAIALRRALRQGGEPIGWRVWAHAFCGLIEQKLLGVSAGPAPVSGYNLVGRRLRQITVMQKGLDDDI